MISKTSMKCIVLLVAVIAIGAFFHSSAVADTLMGSLHDFSMNGASPFGQLNFEVSGAGLAIDEPCVFCHTPHGASTSPLYQPGGIGGQNQMLWNRRVPVGGNNATSFKLYSSASLTMINLQNPTGLSLMCLSCHDGVTSIAVGTPANPTLLNSPGAGNAAITNTLADHRIGDNSSPVTDYLNIGNLVPGQEGSPIDLSNDHPVSFVWVDNIPGIINPTNGRWTGTELRLYNNRMECSTCHNVHDNAVRPFLKMSNFGSGMCRTCHSI